LTIGLFLFRPNLFPIKEENFNPIERGKIRPRMIAAWMTTDWLKIFLKDIDLLVLLFKMLIPQIRY